MASHLELTSGPSVVHSYAVADQVPANAQRGCSSVVEHLLAKERVEVRISSSTINYYHSINGSSALIW